MPETMPPGSLFISYGQRRPSGRAASGRGTAGRRTAGVLDRQQLDWAATNTAAFACDQQIALCLAGVVAHRRGFAPEFFRKEWSWASERNLDFTGSSLAFLCPLVIDEYSRGDQQRNPPSFKTVHIEQAPAGNLQAHQADAIVKAFNAMRARLQGMP